MPTLDEIRKKLQSLDNSNNRKSTSSGQNYKFWDIPTNSSATVRFLPDANPDNTFFWVEKQVIKIPFPGIEGDNNSKEVVVQVPCVEMWRDTCPIHTELRPMFKDPSLEPIARKYWKKKTYLFQGLVLSSPLKEENPPENPIRHFQFGKELFDIVKSSLLDPDFENIPTDYENGTDFVITKGQKGPYASYTTSKWARRESALTPEQLQMLVEYQPVDLNSLLPKKPNSEELSVIFDMFEASMAGEKYDPARWAKYYKPYGFEYEQNSSSNSQTNNASVSHTKPQYTSSNESDTSDSIPFDTSSKNERLAEALETTAPANGSTKSAQDIINMIRNRSK